MVLPFFISHNTYLQKKKELYILNSDHDTDFFLQLHKKRIDLSDFLR